MNFFSDFKIVFHKNNPMLLLITGAFSFSLLSGCGGSSGGADKTPATSTVPTTPTVSSLSVNDGLTRLTASLVDNAILPAYQDMHSAAKKLENKSTEFCALTTPTNIDFEKLKQTWRETSVAWQAARTLKFGPIAETFYYSRVQFWPISASKLSSDVEATLAEKSDFSEGFGSQKHQIQGLPAMEYVLFNNDPATSLLSAQDRENRCSYIKAITTNVSDIMEDTLLQWNSGYAQSFKEGSGDFDSKKHAIEKFLTIWFEYLEIINDDKLKAPLGVGAPGKGDLLESAISLSSLDNIAVNINTLFSQYQGLNEFGFDDYLTEVNNREDVNTSIMTAFTTLLTNVNGLKGDTLADLIKTDEGQIKLQALRKDITELRTIMSTDFVQVTDLAPGFNTNDGD
ncbi:imelysin family protein [Pseudoalteromonas aurantia]|uniref:Imelysin-like domain-containing protein n=2 Tax=Pseudoalteromonas TaxID=53246 RepID=A0ABY2VZC5_9GAMM|nr:imelysin family protein [Pseudoalteromonas aurantia]TMO61025.1 hypothetical protein CWC18_12440 [Pseudoalteromonas aurantia]TMO75756.1 hypothetical protein CWC20_07275 [Pseudoalteromonas aurantia]